MKISKNFSDKELIVTNQKIKNEPEFEHWINLTALVHNVMQPTRERFNVPLTVTSGYRSVELNDKINGAKNSQHTKGEAIDFICDKIPLIKIYNWIKDNLYYDQLILEPSWIHVSFKRDGNNRNQAWEM